MLWRKFLVGALAGLCFIGTAYVYILYTDDFSSYDYYQILGVGNEATKSEIKKAYRAQSLQHHPDKSSSSLSNERFSRIAEAYNVLLDDGHRHQYDMLLMQQRRVKRLPYHNIASIPVVDVLQHVFCEIPQLVIHYCYYYINLKNFFTGLVLLGTFCFVLENIIPAIWSMIGGVLFILISPLRPRKYKHHEEKRDSHKQEMMMRARERQQQLLDQRQKNKKRE